MSTRRPVAQFEYFQALDGEAILKVFDESKGHHDRKVKNATISINGRFLYVGDYSDGTVSVIGY